MKNIIILILLFINYGCAEKESETKKVINPNEIIKSAVILDYKTVISKKPLKDTFPTMTYWNYISVLDAYYCCLCHPDHNNRDNTREVNKDSAYYIMAVINNDLLAELSASGPFPKEELFNHNVTFLYGKYINRLRFLDSSQNIICETSETDGQDILYISRNGNYDSLIIGPLINKPKKMIIEISNSKRYPSLTPEFEIK